MEYFINLEHIHRIHFIGIGGISMSALAKLCHNSGLIVSGSDKKASEITDELKLLGIKIFIGHDKNNLIDADTVVYTIAVSENNEELLEAKNRKLCIYERSDFLRLVCQNYEHIIAVSGTHGKTTTCGMIGSIFISAQKNPTVHMGGECETIGGNLKIGDKKFIITEACEFKKHLLKIPHEVGVVLNIESDHPDSYTGNQDLHDTFNSFCAMSTGINIVAENYVSLLKSKNQISIRTFSFDQSGNYYAKNIRQFKNGKMYFDCYRDGTFFLKICLNCYGKHNVLNALCSIAVADYYKLSKLSIFNGLNNFTGVKRRFRFVAKVKNNVVIEDYAHHPTEIKTTIFEAKKIFNKQVVVFFQPHTYSRTKSLFAEFLKCFDYADFIYILPTYSAREKYIKNASGRYLAKVLNFKNKNCKYLKDFNCAKSQLKKYDDAIVLIIGAGDIEQLSKEIRKDNLNNKFV